MSAEVVDGRMEFVTATSQCSGDVNTALVNAGVVVSELRVEHRSLENVFLGLTGTDGVPAESMSGAPA
ncbi:hypothetical protein [Phytoactinopolyspora endophytica]|uniref:hypothetical protein n=1 Tax=Phytoactinopolyspora endophytica TaxID=1642495 RepID=UPI00101D9B6F|nr:hypothetical protein [Phytoactinopolyspora endophytica]